MSDRDILRSWYSNPSWAHKVDRMSDERVAQVLRNVRQIREECRKQDERERTV